MLTSQEIRTTQKLGFNSPNDAWLAGAKAALGLPHNRSEWLWSEFIHDVEELVELSTVQPAKPGEEPVLDGDLTGSAFDALGGFVSIVGYVSPEGLSFPIRLCQLERIKCLFSGMFLKYKSKTRRIVIPRCDLLAFLNLVPICGPIMEDFL
jgi:hypothetical protein